MEAIVTIIIIFLLFIYLMAQDSKKETKRERYAEAAGELAYSVADSVAGFIHDITEPADKKEIRLAREALANRNGQLYRFDHYFNKDYLEQLLTVDDYFKKSLDILGLSEERWKKIGLHLFYVGVIKVMSREHSDYSKKTPEYIRQHIIDNWANNEGLKDDVLTLKEALAYFHISEEEWIKYGDTVIEMHNINDNNKDLEEFGIITQIMPMKNNRHLL